MTLEGGVVSGIGCVHDVVATPVNVDLSQYADLIATSLTKFIVGNSEAMGGALILFSLLLATLLWADLGKRGNSVVVFDASDVGYVGFIGSNNSLNWARNGFVGAVTDGNGALDPDHRNTRAASSSP